MAASAIPTATPPSAPSAGAAASVNASSDADTKAAGDKLDFVKTLTNLTKTLGNDGSSSDGDASLTGTELSDALLTDPAAVPDFLIADIAQTLGIVPETRSVAATNEAATRALSSVQLQATDSDAATEMLRMMTSAAKQGSTDAAVFDLDVAADTQVGTEGGAKAGSEGVNALGFQTNASQAEQRTQLQVHERVGTPAWREEVGAKLHWMIERGVQSGSLRLSPENLGPLEVRISVQNDQVSVWFGAAHADTRAALENALPRLRELFAAQGMSLADAGVFREPPKQFQQGTPQDGARGYGDNFAGATDSGSAIITSRIGLLDAYA